MSTPPTIIVTSLSAPELPLSIQVGSGPDARHLTVVLRRPGRAGISRIASRIALAIRGDYGTGVVESMDGAGVEMDAILREYVWTLPDELAVIDNGQQVKDNGRPVLDAERVPAELYAGIGEAAVSWHSTFRSVDVRFGAGRGAEA